MNRLGWVARWAMPAWMRGSTLEYSQRAGGAPPSVIKIDVEGAELWALQGAAEILRTVRSWIFLEVHSFAMTSIPEYGHALLRSST